MRRAGVRGPLIAAAAVVVCALGSGTPAAAQPPALGPTGTEPSVCPSDWTPELPVGDQKGSNGACAAHRGFGLDGLIWWGPDWGIPPLGTHVGVPTTPMPDPARPISEPEGSSTRFA